MAFMGMVLVFLAFLFVFILGGSVAFLFSGIVMAKKAKTASDRTVSTVLIFLGALPLTLGTHHIIMSEVTSPFKMDHRTKQTIVQAVRDGSAAEVENFLKGGVSPETDFSQSKDILIPREKEWSLLMYLAYNENVHECGEKMELLIDYGADVNRRLYNCSYPPQEHLGEDYFENRGYNDGCGKTALMIACFAGNLEAVSILLDRGSEVNARDYCGDTPLMYAVTTTWSDIAIDEQLEIVELLLQHGADKAVRSRYAGDLIDAAKQIGNSELISLLQD